MLIAYPTGNDTLRLIFSEPLRADTAAQAGNYFTKTGLKILSAFLDQDPRVVTLKTEPMNGKELKVDTVRAVGVRNISGAALVQPTSPEFIQGIASIEGVLAAHNNTYPFANSFENKVATMSCGKNGGVWQGLHAFGFTYLHEEKGGPYSSIKVVTDIEKKIPGVAHAAHTLPSGKTLHVLWSGGVIKEVNGQTQLVDTGHMEGSIHAPLKAPPPYPIKISDLAGKGAETVLAKSLDASIIRLENVTIESIGEKDNKTGARTVVLSDDSGASINALLLSPVTLPIKEGQHFSSVRAIADQPSAGSYRLLIEFNGALTGAQVL